MSIFSKNLVPRLWQRGTRISMPGSLDANKIFFKYFVYYPVVVLRREWVYPHLRLYEKSQYWSRDELQDYQLSKLNRLIKHARSTCDYYASYPESLSSLDELGSLPLIEKEDIRDSYADFISSKRSLFCNEKTSGGSTGAPVTIRKDHRAMAQELAATWRGYRWAGIDIGDRQARFWGVPQSSGARLRSRLIDGVANRRRISAFNFSVREMERFFDKLLSFRPKYLYGYVSMLREFALCIGESSAKRLGIESVITTAEVLTEPDRELIEQVFGARVYNEYGCGEVGTIAHECEEGSLHINAENIIVEVVGGGEYSEGEIIVTELNNYSMPLIRYRLKDFGVLSDEKCTCGRTLPIISRVGGRAYDMLANTKGQKFHGEFFLYIIEDLKKTGCGVHACQFVQTSLDSLHVKLVPSANYDSSLAKQFIGSRIREKFDEQVALTFSEVSHISREPSGKIRVVKKEWGGI